MSDAIEAVARAFHDEYERRAGDFGWDTQERSRKPWEDVPAENRALMCAVVAALVAQDVIRLPSGDTDAPTDVESERR